MFLIILRRTGILTCVGVAILWCTGCGDVFRPVANPILQPGGDPQRSQHIVVLGNNGVNPGSVSTLDVPGDSNVGTVPVGRGPVYSTLVGSATVIANSMDGTLSVYSSVSPQSTTATITLQPHADPRFIASTDSTTAYVAEPSLNSVEAVSLAASSVIATISVGNNPVAVVETPNSKKVYAVNRGSNTITPIFTVDKMTGAAVPVGNSPVYAVASNDSVLVFVINQGSNSVSVINATTDTPNVPDIPVGSAPNYAFFDPTLKRVYVTNQASNSLSIIDASTSSLIATVSETGGCTGSGPIAVTAITDGSRVYVANRGSNNVCVLNTRNNTFIRSISVGVAPVSIQAASDGSKVFVANSGSNSVSDIRTSDDTVVATLPMPAPDSACTPQGTPTCGVVYLSVAP